MLKPRKIAKNKHAESSELELLRAAIAKAPGRPLYAKSPMVEMAYMMMTAASTKHAMRSGRRRCSGGFGCAMTCSFRIPIVCR